MTSGERPWIVTSATSFFTTESRSPVDVSSEVASMTRSTDANWHSISCVSNLTVYRLPMENGLSPIQKTRARNRRVSIGAAVWCDPTWPRSTKIGSLRMIPTDSPAVAKSLTGAFHRSIDATRNDSALVKSVDILHGKTEGSIRLRAWRRKLVQSPQKRRPVVPGQGAGRRFNQVQALSSSYRNKPHRANAEFLEKFAILFFDLVKNRFRVRDQIHFVDQHNHLIDTQHTQQVRMPFALFLDPFVRGYQEQRGACARSPCDHVFQEFFVPRCINDDVRTGL